jgi:hypothetical protein
MTKTICIDAGHGGTAAISSLFGGILHILGTWYFPATRKDPCPVSTQPASPSCAAPVASNSPCRRTGQSRPATVQRLATTLRSEPRWSLFGVTSAGGGSQFIRLGRSGVTPGSARSPVARRSATSRRIPRSALRFALGLPRAMRMCRGRTTRCTGAGAKPRRAGSMGATPTGAIRGAESRSPTSRMSASSATACRRNYGSCTFTTGTGIARTTTSRTFRSSARRATSPWPTSTSGTSEGGLPGAADAPAASLGTNKEAPCAGW